MILFYTAFLDVIYIFEQEKLLTLHIINTMLITTINHYKSIQRHVDNI